MREIMPRLIPELEEHRAGLAIWRAPAFPVTTFRKLVKIVARLPA
jgi:hypothetical protein